jgi:hypothetical protein
MSSVVRRTFASSPARDAHATWMAIVDLLTSHCSATDRSELVAVAGTATSIISDQAPRQVPIVVTCEGPRTRVYCIYDEDAVEGSDSNEDALGFDPLKGDWAISLPCFAEDLDWVAAALAEKSMRITARDLSSSTTSDGDAKTASAGALSFDTAGFLGS